MSKSSNLLLVLDEEKNIKRWEEARCPICMEHPHNAILLICSSHVRGCRPFMCDTNYPHSNCFGQFRKSFGGEEDSRRPLICPLCRGSICDWGVIEPARNLMNARSRSCERCDFSGTNDDLCEHARSMHPMRILRKWRRIQRPPRPIEDRVLVIQPSELHEFYHRYLRQRAEELSSHGQ